METKKVQVYQFEDFTGNALKVPVGAAVFGVSASMDKVGRASSVATNRR